MPHKESHDVLTISGRGWLCGSHIGGQEGGHAEVEPLPRGAPLPGALPALPLGLEEQE